MEVIRVWVFETLHLLSDKAHQGQNHLVVKN